MFQFFSGNKKSVSQEALANNGFANNFGHAIGGAGYRGVEGVLISNSMKTFVSRCVECTKELYNSDNIVSNFGHAIGGAGYRGVEGVLISNSMKTFVSRCVECTKELYNSDNFVSNPLKDSF